MVIQPDRHLPDLILVDVGPPEPLLVFVEIVATAGPVNESRRNTLLTMAIEANFREEQVAFVTAFSDRVPLPSRPQQVSSHGGRSFGSSLNRSTSWSCIEDPALNRGIFPF